MAGSFNINDLHKYVYSTERCDLELCPDPATACRAEIPTYNNQRYFVCYCSHENKPMIKGTECYRRIVNDSETQNFGPKSANDVIKVQIPNAKGNNPPAEVELFKPSTFVISFVTIFCLVSLLVGMMCFLKRKSLKRLVHLKSNTSKMEWKTYTPAGRLLPDRFINNPTYESSTMVELPVPIFSPDDVKILAQIGQGCFGKVFKGELNGECVAVKMVKNEHSEEATKEVETMATFNHPNILHLIGIAKSLEMECPWLVFEFMEHGDLATVLRNSVRQHPLTPEREEDTFDSLHLTLNSLMDISYQIGEGMKYLSSQHFVHRDLAARNCLVSSWGMVKISDFGLSRDVYISDYYKIGGSRLLPLRWMAPESILYGSWTLESDVWSYGVILWEIYSWGKQPYYGHSNEEVVQLILDGVLLCPPSDCPSIICEIMAGCWKTEPRDRLKFTTIHTKFTKTFKELGGAKNTDEESPYEIPKTKEKADYMEVI